MLAGWAEAFAGDVTKALGHFERTRLLNPRDPAAFYVITGLGWVNMLLGRYEDAAEFAARSAAVYDGWDATYFVLGLALAHSGRTNEARAAVSRLIKLWPGASISHYRRVLPIRDPDRLAVLERDMRTAGLPEAHQTGKHQDADLKLVAKNHLKVGSFYELIPPTGDIHRVVTTGDEPSISLHLLGNDVGCVWRHTFVPETGEVAPFRSGYTNRDCETESRKTG